MFTYDRRTALEVQRTLCMLLVEQETAQLHAQATSSQGSGPGGWLQQLGRIKQQVQQGLAALVPGNLYTTEGPDDANEDFDPYAQLTNEDEEEEYGEYEEDDENDEDD